MKEYTLDFSKVKTIWDFHQALKDDLELLDYYGRNMDALWDCITADIEHPAIIFVKGLHALPKSLEDKKRILLEIFNDAIQWYEKVNSYLQVIIKD